MAHDKNIDRCIQALEGIDLLREAYGPSEQFAGPAKALLQGLALYRDKQGPNGGICGHVAAAIYRTYLGAEPPPEWESGGKA